MAQVFERIVFNLQNAKTRTEELDGREYLVVPAVMLTEGVHNGTRGPILYLSEEMRKNPQVWNLKPAIVYHPEKDANTACTKKILNAQQIGFLMETRFDNKLRTEVWIDTEKAAKVDNRVLDAINADTIMELSTGLFADLEQKSGVFNGVAYTAIARNFQPDHLAILPDEEGACSVAKGAGLLQLNTSAKKIVDNFEKQVQEVLDGVKEKAMTVFNLVESGQSNDEELNMSVKELVDGMISNENTDWEESDREFLMGQDEAMISKMIGNQKPADTKQVVSGEKTAPVTNPVDKTPQPVANHEEAQKSLTLNEYLQVVPPEIRILLENSLQIQTAEKSSLVSRILENESNKLTEEMLQTLEVPVLQNLARTFEAVENKISGGMADYSGAAGGLMGNPQIANANEDPPEGGLAAPVFNFADYDKKTG